ncbi:DNA topoisomerase I [Candidatus Bathyarchaeota archaeon]|nr:DNA topoisomerase I [Candidatus Bathyarchaeota archaeon]MBL7079907.1 DNA topoisomerase I [Candidatus Bathyarchaeota archaeon]
MEQLIHNGVMVPLRYKGRGLTVKVKGQTITLTDEQEERAMAWAKKIGTPYVEDPEFAANFHKDFSEILGTPVLPGDVDYTEIHQIVLDERETRANMTREEKKALAAQRKENREENKEKYGWATIDGERTELGNYTVEPSSIFMGRGQHPMRGKWKEGPRHEDIELNYSSAPPPLGDWKEVHWEPETMWIARWKDKLSGKMKYVWPHDSSPIKQRKDIEKFDKALEFRKQIKKVKNHIAENLDAEDPTRKKTATVTFLIDHCKFRVGDEKDEEEEAETIGASTLRPEHISFNGDGTVTFDFLGKDSVRHTLCIEIPDPVTNNLKEFSVNPERPLFEGVDSKRVSDFLDEVMTGLSAKVFRTHYATSAVEKKLNRTHVDPDAPEYVKKHAATMANLEAAKVCNHKRTIPKTWEQSLQKKRDRLKDRRARARENEKKIKQKTTETEEKYRERLDGYQQKLEEHQTNLEEYKKQLEENKRQEKSTKGLEKRIASKKMAIQTQRERIKKLKITHKERIEKLKVRLSTTKDRDKNAIEKLKLQITAQAETRDYNLGTSMKSYVDPRIYYNWSRKVDYDWRKYYSKTLQSKFSWVEPVEPPAP